MKKLIEAFKEGFRSARTPMRPDGAPVNVQTEVGSKRRQSCAATVIKACEECQAPGIWSNDPEVLDKWPRLWVTATSNALGFPVGNKCPNCGLPRPQNKVLGEVWVKDFK